MEFDEAFTKRMMPKIDYPALVGAAKAIDNDCDISNELNADWESNEEFLRKVVLYAW